MGREQIDRVVCYWQWVPPKGYDGHQRVWKFVESYAIDDNGYPLTQPKNTDGQRTRAEWDKWLYESTGDWDSKPLMGRCVTMWDWSSGAILYDLHPPKWDRVLSAQFVEELRKLPHWAMMLEYGYALKIDTVEEAKKLILAAE